MTSAHDFQDAPHETASARPSIDVVSADRREGGVPRGASRLLAAFGGLLTGSVMIGGALFVGVGATEQTFQAIPSADLDVAAQSLMAATAAPLVEAAKACKRPLGVLTLSATGPGRGRVRFISGGYVSPFVRLGLSAERIALPFPAPPEVGHGQIVVEGENDGVNIFLRPGLHIPAGQSSQTLNVRWDPRGACR